MNRKIKTCMDIIMSIPKTLIFNFHMLPLKQALHLPIFVHYNTKLINIRRGVLELRKVQTGIIRFGFGGTYGIQPSGSARSFQSLVLMRKFVLWGEPDLPRARRFVWGR